MKKKLAINSFIAVTAIAWMGAPTQLQASSSQWRDANSRGDVSARSDSTDPQLSSDDADPGLMFSEADRKLLTLWLAQRPANSLARPGVQRGDRLGHLYPGAIQMLPADIGQQLSQRNGVTLDLLIAEQVVRIMRNSRRVIDTVNA